MIRWLKVYLLALTVFGVVHAAAAATESDPPRPHIIFILVDDLGYGDFGCYGNRHCATPHIDAIASDGLLFRQFYVAAPVCSASRVGFTTGQFPARHRINSFLASHRENRARGMPDFLDPSAPSLARALQAAGYATGHFGKWHLGGGRDVDDAPLPAAYGFDESFTSFEGLGDRLLITGDGLSNQSAKLGQGKIQWAPKHELTSIYIDRALDFLRRNRQQPCYVQLWLNDVHDPFAPTEEQLAKFEQFSANPYLQQYFAVLEELDRQLGRLMAALQALGIDDSTLVLLTSDNGPTAWPRYDREGFDAPGSTAGLRGRKWSLYDGGIREPLIVRWPGRVPAGQVDETSVVAAVDFLPTLCKIASAHPPEAPLDGVDMSEALLGQPQRREVPMYWWLPRHEGEVQPARPLDRGPPLAMRHRQWKLVANADGSLPELYDMTDKRPEYENVAGANPEVLADMLARLTQWKASLPGSQPGESPLVAGRPRMITRFAADVDPDAPWQAYPRQQLTRTAWLNLNGRWQYAIRPQGASRPKEWDGRIVVPYPVESLLSDVQRRVGPKRALWYRRTFDVPGEWDFKRLRIHFGAVDWQATVWINGQQVGEHRGGYDPFHFEIAHALKKDGPQEIVVRVWDPTNDGPQPRGKQVKKPGGIWYTPVTGIWQTVWLEPLPERSIEAIRVTPQPDLRSAKLSVRTTGAADDCEVALTVTECNWDGGRDDLQPQPVVAAVGEQLTFAAPAPVRLWSPQSPWLYHARIDLRNSATGQIIDSVGTYFALRNIELGADASGAQRLLLNGNPVFMLGTLDQGWWPDGLYTAPTEAAEAEDLEITRQLGFNMVRKHVKVESDHWYACADRLGLLVWQDMPSAMQSGVPGGNHVARDGDDLQLPEESKEIFHTELQAMIDALENHPSIVAWVPFNEGWGQHDTNDVLKWVAQRDPSRLVDGPSGWVDRGVGDMLDIHSYPGPDAPPLNAGRASVLGEFGGLGWPASGHTWAAKKNWGYRSFTSQEALQAAYEGLLAKLPNYIERGLAAAVYTQTTDVEVEVNGLMTYDRNLIKFDRQRTRAINEAAIATPLSQREAATGAPKPR